MNCSSVRGYLKVSLAADKLPIPSGISLHLDECEACKSFQRLESQLFQSVSRELDAMVNRPVPPSLLPRVRQQLEELPPSPSRTGIRISGAAVLVLAVFVAVVLLPRNVSRIYSSSQQTQQTENLSSERLPQPEQKRNVRQPNHEENDSIPVPRRSAHSEKREKFSHTEVMVAGDELSGFIALSAAVYREPNIGKAILHPVAQPAENSQPIAPEAIAPLEVSDLEIRPLGADDDGREGPARSDLN
ncbi:MAG: hypothetical protein WAK20_10190 [Candidatus Acidiferrum sp.]